MKNPEEITVFIVRREARCVLCRTELEKGSWITLKENEGPLCLECADLDHLIFLPSGEAALTRRSKKYSGLWAVVLKWARAQKRYQRQGVLVEAKALTRAELECLADIDIRERNRERNRIYAEKADHAYIAEFSEAVRKRYGLCPDGVPEKIAKHACQKYSGRVGRSAAAKSFSPDAIDLAVSAHVRHRETDYDARLMKGVPRSVARAQVEEQVKTVLAHWRS